MIKNLKFYGFIFALLFFMITVLTAQKVETTDGVQIIHNGKEGKWGNKPDVSLELVRKIGDIDAEDESEAFHLPSGIAIDDKGNLYILDSGNHRIQKFSTDGKYITTIGNRGQGPGEFYYPQSLDIDSKGFMYVSDPQNKRIQILNPEGQEYKTIKMIDESIGTVRISKSGQLIMGSGGGFLIFGIGEMDEKKSLPKLLKILDFEGHIQKEFGEQKDYKEFLMNRMGNQSHFTLDKDDNVYVAFDYQNRIEKYSPEGKLLWTSDRKLNYSTTPAKQKSGLKRRGGLVEMRAPQMNRCSSGIAVDEKGRIWVNTLKRQIKEDEQVQQSIMATQTEGGERSMSVSLAGNTDLRETDIYQLEVYSPDGILLGKIQVNQFVDDIQIKGDRLFLLDKMRGTQYCEYKIIDKH